MGLGVGLIGSGYMGKCHALAWTSVATVFPDVDRPRLVALADVTPEMARQQAQAFGFEKGTGDWHDLVSDPEISVISVAAPNKFHADMTVAALEAGKHVWCEKPMATSLEDATRMRDAARQSGRTAILGYNYIQNPMLRLARNVIAEGQIGAVNHIRLEMDEDFMADRAQPFSWKSERASGYGALDDFAVHPLSLLSMLHGRITSLVADVAKPYAKRPTKEGNDRPVETHDIAQALFRTEAGASGVLMVNRSAWGRKGRIALQIFGAKGSLLFDQERMNELHIYSAEDPTGLQGYRTILAAPGHAPYHHFIPAPGHGLGFNELKTIECHELLKAISGDSDAYIVDFERGLEIERVVHAMARSAQTSTWIDV
ncbi:myo-inositol 2-dehydrogenase [Allorhizobium taibaishanense]|uniref:Myo-inositol 2-dehydrogenase n=2 Tax=Allorhizobium taibaishanense TaxID=887144 RepID=A0A1Q9A7Q3_9HYPH|nr:putative dehydrogenase [Allorhizobium taibaishanense]OLP50607.1 myo-inositol 2-dehydrogenase [Allorhizobium taibaishanense]